MLAAVRYATMFDLLDQPSLIVDTPGAVAREDIGAFEAATQQKVSTSLHATSNSYTYVYSAVS